MEHLILTETEFFRLIDNPESRNGLSAAYNEFVATVISLCTGAASPCHPLPALSYAETELQYHKALQDTGTDHSVYVRKALAFVRKMLKHISMPHSQVPPQSSIPSQDEKKNDIPADAPPLRWTGSTVDLIELLYGLDTLKYINGGETGMGELLGHFSRIFGLEIKDSQCYNTYAAIKGRKNGSRTYFFDRASEKLNQRMVQTKNGNGCGKDKPCSFVYSLLSWGKGAREASPCLLWVADSEKTYRQGRSSPKNAYLCRNNHNVTYYGIRN